MKDYIHWGILGTSFISETMAKAIQASECGKLLAVGSRHLSTAKPFADKFSIPVFYDNYFSLLNDPKIDAIYIGLPNHLHKEWMIEAALAGKHILCEKPLVLGVAEALEVRAAVKKARVICMEALMYRYHPLTKKIQELIENQILGKISLYQAVYTANIAQIANPLAGGSIRNLGCYPLSLVRLLAKAEPIEFSALGRMNQERQTDNQASLLLKFADEAMAVISTADDLEMFWQFEVHGSKGRLELLTNPWLPEYLSELRIYFDKKEQAQTIRVKAEKPLYCYQIDAVNQAIQNKHDQEAQDLAFADSLGNVALLEKWFQQLAR